VRLTEGDAVDEDVIGTAAGAKAKSVLRRHWVFAGLVVLAAALRGVVLVAYQPALIFPDSVRYLQYAHNFTTGHWSPDALRQSGYSVAIIPVVLLHALWLLPLLQHLAGLVTAGLVYAVLIRSGARPGLAAVAAVPVLFDPLQLVLEQYVLTDIGAALLIMAALVILAWRRDGPRTREAAAAGLLLGAAVTFRDQDLIMIVPAALYLLVAVRPASRLLTRLTATAGCFLVPVVGYLGWFAAAHGQWNFTTFDGAFLYGRVADFADCRGLALPAYEQPLCPTEPPAQRNADFYTWNPQSPQWTFTPPAGRSRDAVVRDYSLRILRHQPLDYAEAAGRDLLYGFSPVRGAGPEQYSPAYLRFSTSVRPDQAAYASIAKLGYPAPSVEQGPAAFLTDYGRWVYLPGPVLAAGLVLALGGLAASRFRDRGTLLFTASAIAILLPPAMFATFDWRYQLPQLSLIPVAAILGSHAIASRRSAGIQSNPPALPGDGHPAASTPPRALSASTGPGGRARPGTRGRRGGMGPRSAALDFCSFAGGRPGPAAPGGSGVPAGAAVYRLGEVPPGAGRHRAAGVPGAAPAARSGRRVRAGGGGPAPVRAGHGGGAVRGTAAPRCFRPPGTAVGGGAGHGAGAAGRVPAPARVDDHAGRAVRDADRGRAGAAAVAADGQRAAGGGRGAPAGDGRDRAGDRRGARGTRRGLRRVYLGRCRGGDLYLGRCRGGR
jgi:hypothetical protein